MLNKNFIKTLASNVFHDMCTIKVNKNTITVYSATKKPQYQVYIGTEGEGVMDVIMREANSLSYLDLLFINYLHQNAIELIKEAE